MRDAAVPRLLAACSCVRDSWAPLLGGSSFVLLLLLAASGLLLTLVYQPTPTAAYDSVVAIEREVAFGPLVRGMLRAAPAV